MTLVRLPKILSVVQDYLDTNLSIEELVALLNFTKDISRDDAQMLMLPGNFNTPATPVSPSYWLPDYDRIDTMVAEHFGRGQQNRQAWMADPSYANVAIQDTTEDSEAVQSFIGSLIDAGYRNVYDDYPWSEPLAVTQIIAQNGDIQMAESLRQAIGFGEVVVESTGVLESDITVRLGKDWLQRQQRAKTDAGAI
jgi:hypothetical protein